MRERNLEATTISRARAHLDKLLASAKNGGRMLVWLTPKRAAAMYETVRIGSAVDTHRNALAAGKSFGRFCAELGWLPADPFAAVKPIGRRKRGKPQLHLDETRRLIDTCIAEGSRESASVATAVLLGCGASEVVGRHVRDLDELGHDCDSPLRKPGRNCTPTVQTSAGRHTMPQPWHACVWCGLVRNSPMSI